MHKFDFGNKFVAFYQPTCIQCFTVRQPQIGFVRMLGALNPQTRLAKDCNYDFR